MTPQKFIAKFPNQRESNANEMLEDRACPMCGSRTPFRVTAVTTATITNEGVEDTEDHEWEDDSACQCRACGHSATVIAFTIPGLDSALLELDLSETAA
jgi:rubredoxin